MRRTLTLAVTLMDAVPKGRRRFLWAVLLAMLASSSSVALMGVSAWLLSFAAMAPPVLYLQPAAVLVRAFAISRAVFRYVERLFGHDLALRMQSALRIRVYDKLAATTLIGRRRGDLLTRVIADAAAINDLVVRVVIPFASAALVVLATTVMFAVFNWPTALFLLLTAVLAGVVLPMWTQRASLAVDTAAVPTRGRLADGVRELARTSTDLVAYGAGDATLERLLAVDDELREQEARGAWIRGIATGGQLVAAGIAVLAALFFGTQALEAGALDPRMLAVLVLTPLAMHEVLGEPPVPLPQRMIGWRRPFWPRVRGRYTVQVLLTLLLVTENEPLEAKLDTDGKPVPGSGFGPGSGVPGLVARAPADNSMPSARLDSLRTGAFICGSLFLLVL